MKTWARKDILPSVCVNRRPTQTILGRMQSWRAGSVLPTVWCGQDPSHGKTETTVPASVYLPHCQFHERWTSKTSAGHRSRALLGDCPKLWLCLPKSWLHLGSGALAQACSWSHCLPTSSCSSLAGGVCGPWAQPTLSATSPRGLRTHDIMDTVSVSALSPGH